MLLLYDIACVAAIAIDTAFGSAVDIGVAIGVSVVLLALLPLQ